MNDIVIYQDSNDQIELNVQLKNDTLWLSQKEMAELFEKDSDTIGFHLKNIYQAGELNKEATTEKYSVVREEGGREVNRKIQFYNLDAIISVGYRVNSVKGTQFRIWATDKLNELLVRGYVYNEKRLAQKEQEVKVLRSGIQILSRVIEQKAKEEGLDWLDTFSKGLGLLDDYDHESLDKTGISKKKTDYPALEDYYKMVETMRADFDSTVFGKEKDDNFKSSITQISKGMGDQDFYPSIEEKAAMLLYLITKNHSFVDGNKRIAAACFLLFLEKNDLLYVADQRPIISNEALAALTLYIASSKPGEMETVKRLIISVLNRNQ